MSTIWHCSKEWIRNAHKRHINKHLEIFLHCWVIWKVAFRAPPPPVARSIWASHLGILATQLGISPRVKAPNPDATQGEMAWVALWWAFPDTQRLSFCLVLLNYMTSGPFSWCYFLLLTQRFFWYYFIRKVMAILCCVAQKAASAAQLWRRTLILASLNLFHVMQPSRPCRSLSALQK